MPLGFSSLAGSYRLWSFLILPRTKCGPNKTVGWSLTRGQRSVSFVPRWMVRDGCPLDLEDSDVVMLHLRD